MGDANFKDRLLENNSRNVHENNIHILIEIYQSISILSPPIIKDLFDLKSTQYDLSNKKC